MKKRLRIKPTLEMLEDRYVPANILAYGSTLNITASAGEASMALLVQQGPSANQFTITDHGSFNGSYKTISNISITGTNGADSIQVNLGGLTYTGSLGINPSNGNDTVALFGPGALLGNVTILAGPGNNTVEMNGILGAAGGSSMTVGGSTNITEGTGNDTVTFGNTAGASQFLGSVTVTNANFVTLGQGAADRYGQSVTVQNTPIDGHGLNLAVGFDLGASTSVDTISVNLTVTAGGGVSNFVGIGAADIFGTVNVNLGNSGASNSLELGATNGALAQLNPTIGSLSYTGGGASNLVDFDQSTINGSATLNLSGGSDSVALDGNGSTSLPSIGGSLTVNEGNGNLNLTPYGDVLAHVGGNMTFNLGNGLDSATIGIAPGGTLNWTSGNNTDALTLGDANTPANSIWKVAVQFGSNDDTFTLNGAVLSNGGTGPTVAAPQYITGKVDGGGHLTANSFVEDVAVWTLEPTFQLLNF